MGNEPITMARDWAVHLLIHLEDLLPADFFRGGHLRGKSMSEDTMAKEFKYKDAIL